MADDQNITEAELDWGAPDDGVAPRSIFFNDIYFSGDGPAETTHVFLTGNNLPARYKTAEQFTIGELGFGTGLNFLAAWAQWQRAEKPAGATLHFFSVEAFPLSPADLERAHAHWPELAALSQRLRDAYPPPLPGLHHLDLGDGVTLTLFIGDVLTGLQTTEAQIDAWFLDGFSPDKNPQMWSPQVMTELAGLSRDGATLATFTVAGAVRRGLIAAGFEIEKRPGFGRKRQMLGGRINRPDNNTARKPWYDTRASIPLKPGANIAIVGAGIAGASLAYALRAQGYCPTLIDPGGLASGASGNPAGLIMPRLDADDTPAARFHTHAYLYTERLIKRLQEQTPGQFFNPCGALMRSDNDRERARQKKILSLNVLPSGWIEEREDGLFFPQGGVIDPRAFVTTLAKGVPIITKRVCKLCKTDTGVCLSCDDNTQIECDAVVIANGLDAMRFSQSRSLPLTGSAGQIDLFPGHAAPDHAIASGAYAAPTPGGDLVIGATYAPITIGALPAFSPEATRTTIDAVQRFLPEITADLSPEYSTPRASIRCTTPDQLPVAGPMPDWGFYSGAYDDLRRGRVVGRCGPYPPGKTQTGIYILTSLGSRGLVTAPLAAAFIAAEIASAPSPLDAETAEALHPARFFIRDIKRTKILPLT